MSENTFPFAEGDDAAPYVDAEAANRKPLFIAGGVVAALVLGAGGWLLLGGGGSNDATDTAFVPHHTVRPAVTAPKTVAKPATKKLPAAYTARLGRDPFKALYVVPVAPPPAAPVAPPAPPAATTPVGTGTGTNVGTTRYTLKLVSISKPSPEVRTSSWMVAGVAKTVLPAQRFGKFGEVVVLAYSKNATGVVDRAVIQVGDDSPIDVAVGESVSIL